MIVFFSVTLHKEAMKKLIGERNARVATVAANAINAQLLHLSTSGKNLALRAADGTPPEAILESTSFLLNDFDEGLAFLTPNGVLISLNGDPELWKSIQNNIETAIQAFRSQSEITTWFSSPFVPSGQQNAIVLTINGDPTGANPLLVGAFTPAKIAQSVFAGVFAPTQQATVMLLDRNFNLIYQTGDSTLVGNTTGLPILEENLNKNEQVAYDRIDTENYIIAFSPIETTDWHLVYAESQTAIENPLLNSTLLAPLVLVPVFLLSLLALWFGARKIVCPLQSLENLAKELAWGNFEAIEKPVGGIEEIQQLQKTLVYLSDKVRSTQKNLHSYIGAITTGQEEERRRLARELHDETLQSLIALNQRIQLARMHANPETDEKLAELQTMTEQNIQNLRRLTQALRPLYLEDLGLVPALEMLVKETSQTAGFPIDFLVTGTQRRLPPEVEVTIFRMVQESLSNILRHAQASHASVQLQFMADKLRLTVTDNGKGFEEPKTPSEFAAEGHFGLLGLYERAELIGAQLKLASSIGKGTQILVSVPLSFNHEDHN
jgi:signal transduction histidine kinase